MIRASFKNPYLVLVFTILVILSSSVLIPRMPIDILPQFKKSAMQILTLYPGMPAEVVEKDITSRMERWTGQSPGIEKQLSKSIMGVSVVTNFYGEDVDPAEAMANTSSYAMSDMYYQPPGTLPPMIQPFDPTASKPLMLLTVSSAERDGKDLYDKAYYSLRQMLSGVKGIIAPAAYGGALRRIYVYVDPVKMESLNISQTEVNDAIQRNTTMIPSGIAKIGDVNYGVDAKGMIVDISDFDDILIKHVNGKPVYIHDIGRTENSSAIPTNIARVDAKEQVYLPIFKRPNANTISAVNAVRKALPNLKDRMPDDIQLGIIFDQSSYVRKSINGLVVAALGGIFLVIVVLLLFLGNWRSAIVISIALPLSILFAFVILSLTGQAINSITLGGIALVLGLVVDNSIVVIENIDHHLSMGKTRIQAALDASLEVAKPVLASSLVVVVVFLPVVFLTGISKYLFSPLAITVAGAMLGSYIFSLTLVPLLLTYIYRGRSENTKAERKIFPGFQRMLEGLKRIYLRSLERVLKIRRTVLFIVILIFGGAMYLFTTLGYELFPASDVGQMEIQVRMESGTPLDLANRVITSMEEEIRVVVNHDLEQVISNIGVFYDLPAAYTPNSGTQDAFIGVQLKKKHSKSTSDYATELRAILVQKFPGIELSFNTGGLITAALNEGKPAPIDVQVKGNDLYLLQDIAKRIQDTIALMESTRDVRILQRLDQPTKDISLDRIKAAELGVEPVDAIKNVVSALNSSTTYQKAFWIDENNGNHYYVGVTYPPELIDQENVLDNVMVGSKWGDKAIPFRNFSSVSESTSPVEINHHNLSRVFNVYSNVEGEDIGSVSDKIQMRIDEIKKTIPRGYEVTFEGEVAIIKSSFSSLILGLILAVILAFLIVTPLFRSLKQPFIILASFPLGLIGVVLLMLLTSTYLSIQSIMGIIMMVGIAVSYGNILIDKMNQLVKNGEKPMDAILNGASNRFRPILMTASTTIFGLLPIVFSVTSGAEANVPLAIAVIGGTFMATLLTFYIIPILYSFTFKKNESH
jgi:CzcA family heavy metal efflux pump